MFRGLRQGDGLSCLLFICVLSVIFYDAEQAWKQATAHITDRDRVIEAFGREVAKYADDSNLELQEKSGQKQSFRFVNNGGTNPELISYNLPKARVSGTLQLIISDVKLVKLS